jgi:hypothetical protein
MLEFTVIRNVAKMFLWLDYSFMPKKMLETILGKEDYTKMQAEQFFAQPPEEMLKQYHFQPMGSSTTAIKEVRIQQIMQAYKLFNQDPMVNQHELRKMVIDVLDLKNESKLLKSPEQMQTEAQQAQMQQAMMAQQGQPPGQPGQMPPPQQPGKGGEQGPQPPSPPDPGNMPQSPTEQMSQLLRIAGGGLIKGTPAGQIQQME